MKTHLPILRRCSALSSTRGGIRTEIMLALLLISILLVLAWLVFGHSSGQHTVFASTGPTITQLERLGEMVVLRIYVSDVLVADGEGYRGSWLIKGDAVLSIDLRAAQIIEKDDDAKHAKIVLPALKVIQPRLDHRRTMTWDIKKTTWIHLSGDPDKLRDSAMLQAQYLVESRAQSDEAVQEGRENAALIVKSMYRLLDWQIEVAWSDMPNAPPHTAKQGSTAEPGTAK
jgi:hypothetical protein